MTNETTPSALLSLIRGSETSRGYEDYSRFAKVAPPKPVTQMTVNEVREWQRRAIAAGSQSVAIGGYQLISDTFDGVVREIGLTGDEVFEPALQDRMGTHLLGRRGYNDWASGRLTDDQFADNLAQEWAAFPRFTGPKRGRSHYDGDGLNASRTSIEKVQAALNATRNGELIDFAGPQTPGSRAPSPMAPTQSEQERQLKLDSVNPNETYTGADMSQIGATPVRTFRDTLDDRAIAAEAEAAQPTFWEGAKLAADDGWIGTTLLRQLGREEFTPDQDFQFSPELWDELTTDMPRDYQEAFGGATSEAHARAIAKEIQREMEVNQKLGSMGVTGAGLRIGAALLDPIAITASVASEGLLAPLIYTNKVSKVGRFLRGGAAAGAVNAGIEGYLTSQTATQDWENVAYAAAAGFVIGGAVGAFSRTVEDARLGQALQTFVKSAPALRQAPTPGVSMANDGSFGAARVPGPLTPSQTVIAESKDAPFSALGRVRIDNAGILKQSQNGVTRRLTGLLVEDGVGNANGAVNVVSASEKVARDARVRFTRFYREYDQAFRDWSAETGTPFYKQGAAHRAAFNNAVGMAVRRNLDATPNPHVARMAAKVKAEFKDLLEFGKDHNIRGFSELKDNYNYMTRRHRIQALDDLVNKWGDTPVMHMVAESIQSANRKWANRAGVVGKVGDDLSDGLAFKIAKAYIKSIRSRKYGEFDLNRALAGQDMDTLKMMLDDAGLDPSEIVKITDAVRFSPDAEGAGRMGNAKWRLDLDETYSKKVYGPGGVEGQIRIEDFLENDVEFLFTNYARSVLGAGHLEDALSQFKVPNEVGELPVHSPSFETVKRYIADEASAKGLSEAEMRKEFSRLDNIYKAVAGIPIEPPSGFREFQRFMRDYNFIRIGGQLGIAQLAEIGNILGNGGFRVMMQHMPSLRKVFAKANTGTFSDEFYNEIEAIWGHGTDFVRNSPNVKMDDVHGTTFEGRDGNASGLQKADFALQQGKRLTAVTSGMAHINMALQRFNTRVLVQRFMDNATGDRTINTKRMRTMGLDDAMIERVNNQLLAHVDTSKGALGRPVKRININKWDDLDAKNAFINGVDRWAKKSIQENDIGNMPNFMSYEMGKTIGQFRSFMLAAYTKQLLSGVHHRDWETFSAWGTSMFFGGLFYVAQTNMNAIGRSDREEWLEERLSADNVAKASFLRAGFSSLIPLSVDTVVQGAGYEPVFDFRTSDLGSSLLGNPTYDLLMNIQRGAQGVAAPLINPDYEFSKQDYRAITSTLFMQNAFGVRNILASLGSNLPNYSQ